MYGMDRPKGLSKLINHYKARINLNFHILIHWSLEVAGWLYYSTAADAGGQYKHGYIAGSKSLCIAIVCYDKWTPRATLCTIGQWSIDRSIDEWMGDKAAMDTNWLNRFGDRVRDGNDRRADDNIIIRILSLGRRHRSIPIRSTIRKSTINWDVSIIFSACSQFTTVLTTIYYVYSCALCSTLYIEPNSNWTKYTQ